MSSLGVQGLRQGHEGTVALRGCVGVGARGGGGCLSGAARPVPTGTSSDFWPLSKDGLCRQDPRGVASPPASCHPAVPSLIPPALPAPQPSASPGEASSRERVGATPGAQLCPLSPTPFLVSPVPWGRDGG